MELSAQPRPSDAKALVKLLLDTQPNNADPNTVNCQGDTPLHLAARRSGPEFLASLGMLIQAGADPNVTNLRLEVSHARVRI